jgi:predicted TIM-barrel fold metal-dependent hydrolase
MLAHAIAAIGADRIMFSSDYPFQYSPNGGARAFLDTAPITWVPQLMWRSGR